MRWLINYFREAFCKHDWYLEEFSLEEIMVEYTEWLEQNTIMNEARTRFLYSDDIKQTYVKLSPKDLLNEFLTKKGYIQK